MGFLDDVQDAVDKAVDEAEDQVQGATGIDFGGSGGGKNADDVTDTNEDTSQGVTDNAGQAVSEASEGVSQVADEVQDAVDQTVPGGSGGSNSSSSGSGGSSNTGGNDFDSGDDYDGGSSGDPSSPGDSGSGSRSRNQSSQNQKSTLGQDRGNKSSSSGGSGSTTQGNRTGNGNKKQAKGWKKLQKQSDFFVGNNEKKTAQYYQALRNRDMTDKDRDLPGPTASTSQMLSKGEEKELIVGDENYQTTAELREQANIDFAENVVLQTMDANAEFNKAVEKSKIGETAQKIENVSPVDVPVFDFSQFSEGVPKELSDTMVVAGGGIAFGSKVLEPLNPIDGKVVDIGKGGKNAVLNYGKKKGEKGKTDYTLDVNPENLKAPDVGESASRLASFPGLVKKGGSQFVKSAKENPSKTVNQEILPEAVGLLVGSAPTTTTTTTSASNVNINIQESYLPQLENAQGETLTQARIKQGAGSRNTGQEQSQGRSVSKKGDGNVKTQGEQPALYGKVEYEAEGQKFSESYIGEVKTSSESQVQNQGDQSGNPMEEKQFTYTKKGDATVSLEKIGENRDVGKDVQKNSDDQIIIDEIQAEGSGKENPLMVQADPDGNVQVGFEKKSTETGEVGNQDYTAISKESGIRDLESGTEKTTSTTVTQSDRGSSKTSSENLAVDQENLPDADQVRNQKGSGKSSDSKPFKDLSDSDSDVSADDSSVIDEMMGESESDSTDTSSSSQDSQSNFDKKDYDGAGTGQGQLQFQRKPDSEGSGKTGPSGSTTESESFKKALEEKISGKEIQVKSKDVSVKPGVEVAQNQLQEQRQDLQLDNDLNLDQGTTQDQKQEQENPPKEEQINFQELNFGSSTTSSTTTSSSFISETSVPRKTSKPDPDINLEDDEKKQKKGFFDKLLGEKARGYQASLDAEILGIYGTQKEHDLGTRPILKGKKKKERGPKKVKIDSKENDLFST